MRISMWTSYLMELSAEDMVKAFAEAGWQYLEFSDEHGNALLRRNDPLGAARELVKIVGDLGVSFPQGHYMLTWGDYDRGVDARPADIASLDDTSFAEHMDQMKRWVDLFNELGVGAGVLHAGGHLGIRDNADPGRVRRRQIEALQAVADHAAGGPTTICLENLGHVPSAEKLNSLIDATERDNIAICLDTGHLNIAGGVCADFVRTAGPRLQALHIADNLGENDDHMLPYGKGTVGWTPFMQALREIGYDGLFNYEVPGETQRCPLPARLAKLDYAKRLAEWMVTSDGAEA
jgi:sugar phosphate isomerase/epimerase